MPLAARLLPRGGLLWDLSTRAMWVSWWGQTVTAKGSKDIVTCAAGCCAGAPDGWVAVSWTLLLALPALIRDLLSAPGAGGKGLSGPKAEEME